jgi:hypothetical protein
MSIQVAKEDKETFAKLVNFWVTPDMVKRLNAVCGKEIVRSEVLRELIEFFLDDIPFQKKILEMVRRRNYV